MTALESQTYPSALYEIIVVDNGSTEPVAPLLTPYLHARAEFEATPGSYAARNRGIAVARGHVLAFTDADCIPSSTWLEEGVACLDYQDAPLIGGRIVVFPREATPTAVELYEMLYAFPQEENVKAGFTVTANLFCAREVIEKLGPFDQNLKSYGDVDWTSRAVKAGFKLAYCDEAVIRHPARRSLQELRQRYARFAGGHYTKSRLDPKVRRYMRIQALHQVKPPVKLARRLLSDTSSLGLFDKARVIAVGSFVRWSYVFEWVRLELGARPRR
jgi:GT2 family glycosyltransferase